MLLSSFVFGLVFGSFLNVVIHRLKTRQDIVLGGSFCPECKTRLRWYDLMPLLSFTFLKGKCRYCHKKISWQYPIVELISAFLWVSVFYKFGISWNAIYHIFILSALLVIAVYDFKWQIIPDKIIYPAIIVAFIYSILNAFKLGDFKIFLEPLFAALIAFLFFFLFFYFSKGKAMGLGDAKLAFLIGLFLGPLLAIAAFMLSFIIGAIFGIILIGLGNKSLKSQIALGPFLVLGAVITLFFSNFISNFLNFW